MISLSFTVVCIWFGSIKDIVVQHHHHPPAELFHHPILNLALFFTQFISHTRE